MIFFIFNLIGNENQTSLGVIHSGKCNGAFIFKEDKNLVTRGTCTSPYGIKMVQAKKGALVAIRGNGCDSTCWGQNTQEYRPGKTIQ